MRPRNKRHEEKRKNKKKKEENAATATDLSAQRVAHNYKEFISVNTELSHLEVGVLG